MSLRAETARARMAAALWELIAAVRQTWRQPARRPVLVGLVVVPVAGLAALLFLPAGTEAQAPASPSPSVAAVSAPAAAPAPAVPAGKPASDQFRQRNPFRVRQNRAAEPPPPPPSVAAPPPTPPPQPIDASTKLDLLGTFVMGKDRYAVIVLKQKQQEVVVKEDESPLPNSRIIRILPREVRMLLDGQEAVLKLDFIQRGQGGAMAAAPQPVLPQNPYATPPVTVPDLPQLPPGVDGQAKRLARSEVDQYLDNLNQLLTQVNVQPVFQAGQPSGFRLTDIQRGTILDQIGIQDGDTLRFVNGQRIDSVQSAFQLYNILKESTNVEITVIRNTRPVTLRYLIY